MLSAFPQRHPCRARWAPAYALSLLLSLPWAASAARGPLDLPPGSFSVSVETAAPSVPAAAAEYLVRFPSPLKSPFPANDTVWAHLILPHGRPPFPTILVLPVMAAPNVWIETQFMKRLVADGFAVVWVEMPYQFHRRPRPLVPSGQVFLARTAKRLAFNYRQSVLDARRTLRWMSGRPEIDRRRVGIFGVSLGALVGAAVYSVDPLPRYAVFLLGGAGFPTLATTSSMTAPFLRKMGILPGQLSAAWKGIDPVDYAQQNKGKPVLLINARSDSVIPYPSALRLKSAFPDSRQVWVPFGHYTAILHLFWIPGFVSRDFQRHLAALR